MLILGLFVMIISSISRTTTIGIVVGYFIILSIYHWLRFCFHVPKMKSRDDNINATYHHLAVPLFLLLAVGMGILLSSCVSISNSSNITVTRTGYVVEKQQDLKRNGDVNVGKDVKTKRGN
jgi:hypothetical protein